jgi:hypothetical protein
MKSTIRFPSLAILCGMAIVSTSCGHECLALPCALPLAVVINLTAATSASVEGATVAVSGATTALVPCPGGTCRVPGTSGTYELDVTAPGFVPVRRTVTVQGSNPPCGCPTVVTETVAIALARPPG